MSREDQKDYRWAPIKNLMKSRTERRVSQNLGIIRRDGESKAQIYRNPALETYDAYYEKRQYDHLPEWDKACAERGDYVAVRSRKPRLNHPFAKTLSTRLTAKLIGDSVFPKFKIEDSPEDTDYVRAVIREANLKYNLLEPVRRCLNSGSSFLRFKVSGGRIVFKRWDSKVCYPTFAENGELERVEIKYVYADFDDRDTRGEPKKKWYKLELNTESEMLFDNPLYVENEEPTFSVVSQFDHGFGFVQGQWLQTVKDHENPDGYGLVSDILSFIDEFNYSLSQSSQSVSYNQDPILTFNDMNEDEQESLIRSVMKAWNLGRTGKAQFLESNLNGVQRAMELRDKVTQNISEITRVLLLDPEKIVGSAQSAKAMEILYGPMKDLIDELRLSMGTQFKELVEKLAALVLFARDLGVDVPIVFPDGYAPKSLAIELSWPPIFQQTMADLKEKVGVAAQASGASIISRESATRWVCPDFGIEDPDEEIKRINSQPILNPFGAF